MSESSSRILVDRSVIRLDGRPFFSFGPRILLTTADRFPKLLKDIARRGFTVVGSPPCSPGTVPLIHAFFDAAEAADLMVVLIADPRLPEHGRYLADEFRKRSSLHSYVLPPRDSERDELDSYRRDRDSIRAHDLFHPIWMPLVAKQFDANWLRTQDVFAPLTARRDATQSRMTEQRPGLRLAELNAKSRGGTTRPLFCADLRVLTSDEERSYGIFSDDPAVSPFPNNSIDWFPYLANFHQFPRRDLLGPPPELLRLQVYELISAGTRGVLLDFHEAFLGTPPFSGHDRFCEASILARELSVFEAFFAEGRPETVDIETGHPRTGAVALRHGNEILLVLRMEGYEEDYFIDEAYMERTEISVNFPNNTAIKAWRMDFPAARPLEVMRDSAGAMRFLAGPLELTGLILLTPGTQRSTELATKLAEFLPEVAQLAVEELEVRVSKLTLIEGELRKMGVGVDNEQRLLLAQQSLEEARGLIGVNDFANAYQRARQGSRILRMIVKYQMAKALAMPVHEKTGIRNHLRNSYFTLPRFYREGALETSRAFSDLT